jgi:hypothetical protein
MKSKRGAWVAAAAAMVIAGCGTPAAKTVSMRMKGAVPDAQVIIDDEYVGTLVVVQKRGVALPPGKHRISVERQGFFPWDKLVEVHEGDPPVQLEPVLTPIPD